MASRARPRLSRNLSVGATNSRFEYSKSTTTCAPISSWKVEAGAECATGLIFQGNHEFQDMMAALVEQALEQAQVGGLASVLEFVPFFYPLRVSRPTIVRNRAIAKVT